jgi:hypothetical protein
MDDDQEKAAAAVPDDQGLADPHKRFPARLLLCTVMRKGP